MPFEEGQSGNPGGRPKKRFTQDALLIEMKAREADGDKRGMRAVAVKVWDLAEGGERWAAEFIRDTLDGKPAQQINLADDEGGPLTVVLKQFVLNAEPDTSPK